MPVLEAPEARGEVVDHLGAAGLELAHEPLAQRLLRGEHGVGVRVLGAEVRLELGRALLLHPIVFVDAGLTVERAAHGRAPRGGRPGPRIGGARVGWNDRRLQARGEAQQQQRETHARLRSPWSSRGR